MRSCACRQRQQQGTLTAKQLPAGGWRSARAGFLYHVPNTSRRVLCAPLLCWLTAVYRPPVASQVLTSRKVRGWRGDTVLLPASIISRPVGQTPGTRVYIHTCLVLCSDVHMHCCLSARLLCLCQNTARPPHLMLSRFDDPSQTVSLFCFSLLACCFPRACVPR